MKKVITHFLFAIAVNAYGQTEKCGIEIIPFIRYDRQTPFFSWETVLGGKNYVGTKGISYGLNLNIRRNIKGENIVYIGSGLYKHTISKIKRYNDNNSGNN